MGKWFSRFPLTNYDGKFAKQIFARIRIMQAFEDGSLGLHPYTIREGERADSIAELYYGDSYYDWAIYLINGIQNPHFEWPKSEFALQEYIVEMYGSIQKAQRKILFYRIDWAADENIITPEEYAALTNNKKKFYAPNIGIGHVITHYERKQADWTVATNQIIELTCNTVTGFEREERVNVNSGIVFGDIVRIDTTNNILTVQNIGGTGGSFSNGQVLVGDNTGSQATVSNVNSINIAIDASEANYWVPVSAYDYENEENQKRREIVLLDKAFVQGLESMMVNLLSA